MRARRSPRLSWQANKDKYEDKHQQAGQRHGAGHLPAPRHHRSRLPSALH